MGALCKRFKTTFVIVGMVGMRGELLRKVVKKSQFILMIDVHILQLGHQGILKDSTRDAEKLYPQ